jgi:hypothetical protein
MFYLKFALTTPDSSANRQKYPPFISSKLTTKTKIVIPYKFGLISLN